MILTRRCGRLPACDAGKGLCYRIYCSIIAKEPQARQHFTSSAIFNPSGLPRTEPTNFLCKTNPVNVQYRCLSSSTFNQVDQESLQKDAEKKIGWVLKTLFLGTASFVAYNLFPYMGENVIQQSVSLLKTKDPLFKRMGASRVARIAIDDERRMKIVELGGVQHLLNMLAFAKDDRTRLEALKALVAICKSDAAATAVQEAGGAEVIDSTPDSESDSEIGVCKSTLASRFRELRH